MRKNNKYTNEFKKRVSDEYLTGNESFYFLLNDANTQNFLPEDQEEILKTKDAYSCIYNK